MTFIRAHASSVSDSASSSLQVNATTFAHQSVFQALQLSYRLLQDCDIDEPDLSVTNLLAASLNLPWESGFRDLQAVLQNPSCTESSLASRQLTVTEANDFANLVQRRLKHEPIQYLVGQWDFYGHIFSIQPPLLCPRPETEQLVELVAQGISQLSFDYHRPVRILDIGAGTGCIGISLAAAAAVNTAVVHALDIEPVAVQTSQWNAERILGKKWNDVYSVSLDSANEYSLDSDEPLFDVIVSNPPYIPRADYDNLHPTVKLYESADALVAGNDGMDVIKTILRRLPEWARPGALCWMEVDPSQPDIIRCLCEETFQSLEYMETIQDLYGKYRFVKIQVK
jgi:release factor glutamine methyltransferase